MVWDENKSVSERKEAMIEGFFGLKPSLKKIKQEAKYCFTV